MTEEPEFEVGVVYLWSGGHQPVEDGTYVHIWLRKKEGWDDTTQQAEDCYWHNEGASWDIIKFKVVKYNDRLCNLL